MFIDETKIRVRYSETDRMGYCYYGNYPQYFEVARTEMLRKTGISYKDIEDAGIIMPVSSMEIKYIKPALYDDLLTIKTILNKKPGVKIIFDYEIYNQNNVLLCKANTKLVFVNQKLNKPTLPPDFFMNKMKPYF